MLYKIKNFNPLTSPLNGTKIIEASAGTGKTYTIIIIYLRLLLKINNNKNYTNLLSIKNILILNFTELSTKEFKNRIKKKIKNLRLDCIKKKSNDIIINILLKKINCFYKINLYLLKIEQKINEASIFTIHSFCKHILNKYFIECNILPIKKILSDEYFLQKKVINNFWRKNFYKLPLPITKLIKKQWKDPEYLLKKITPFLIKTDLKIPKISNFNESTSKKHKNIKKKIKNIKKYWYKIIPLILKKIKNSKIKKIKKIKIYLNKINKWIKKPINKYTIPNEIKYFKKLIINRFKFNIFIKINIIKNKINSLKNLIFISIIKNIIHLIKKEKENKNILGFNDIINKLNKTLINDKNNSFKKTLYKSYPITIIDEFQDTDSIQYNIFRNIYKNKKNYSLILIGDPKQAIYSFRGADIFNYINIKKQINNYYTLNKNWRSTKSMINAVNNLFKLNNNPFFFKEIYFSPIDINNKNYELKFIINKKSQPGLSICIKHNKNQSSIKCKNEVADYCAINIKKLINYAKKGKAYFRNKKIKKNIKISDITIIVRNITEAKIIKKSLNKFNILSNYLSNKKNIFNTLEAYELLSILQAILNPKNILLLKRALITNIFSLNAKDIYKINKNKNLLLKWINKFLYYKNYWKKLNIFKMLNKIIIQNNKKKQILIKKKIKLINLIHISELLQKNSIKIKKRTLLIYWFIKQIESPNLKKKNQICKEENNKNCIKIITIHKSKGLEFPIVFIPFANNFYKKNTMIFHDRKNYKTIINFNKSKTNFKLENEEKLAEDIRLLYVSITRSIYHCNISIIITSKKSKKKNNITNIHLSAIGYIIQNGEKGDINILYKYLKNLVKKSKRDIKIYKIKKKIIKNKNKNKKIKIKILKKNKKQIKILKNNFNITSYTKLKKYQYLFKINKKKYLNLNLNINKKKKTINNKLTIHKFERNNLLGNIMHDILEKIDFKKKINKYWLKKYFIKNNINISYLLIIKNWIKKIINTPLKKNFISLSELKKKNYKTELKFYFSIKNKIKSKNINKICKKYDKISSKCPELKFPNIIKNITGVIDLFFKYKNKYYLLDYKSDWLGINNKFYNKKNIEKAIINNRYDLQYQIYTLALHKFLKYRIKHYKYSNNFGGIFILFLRGINYKKINHGIYYTKLKKEFIYKIDKIFNK